ncbi:hypothetical protein LI291_14220, partial [Intestinibacillus massiliensis]|nr:hypothetical protein [Intestinibacillus massiliensis]
MVLRTLQMNYFFNLHFLIDFLFAGYFSHPRPPLSKNAAGGLLDAHSNLLLLKLISVFIGLGKGAGFENPGSLYRVIGTYVQLVCSRTDHGVGRTQVKAVFSSCQQDLPDGPAGRIEHHHPTL